MSIKLTNTIMTWKKDLSCGVPLLFGTSSTAPLISQSYGIRATKHASTDLLRRRSRGSW